MQIARQTQSERTAGTTQKILVAALEIIETEGISCATTTAIATKANVSRGALLHHYPAKFDLIAASVEYLLDVEGSEIENLSESVSTGELSIDDFLEKMWKKFSGRLFMVTLDFLAVARTDTELREHLIPISLAFNKRLDGIWQKFFVDTNLPQIKAMTALNLSMCLLRGMGVQTILRPDDDAYFEDLLSTWKSILPQILHVNHPSNELKQTA